jgi:hypothetical protein
MRAQCAQQVVDLVDVTSDRISACRTLRLLLARVQASVSVVKAETLARDDPRKRYRGRHRLLQPLR